MGICHPIFLLAPSARSSVACCCPRPQSLQSEPAFGTTGHDPAHWQGLVSWNWLHGGKAVVPCLSPDKGIWELEARGWVAGPLIPTSIDGVGEAGALPEPGRRKARPGSSSGPSGLPPGPVLEAGCLPGFQDDEPTPLADVAAFGIWFPEHNLDSALFPWFSLQVPWARSQPIWGENGRNPVP